MQNTTCKINIFGEKLGYLLSIKGWSQQKLADKLRITQQCVSRWVNGNREPCIDDILLICQLLDEDPNELLGFNDIPAEAYADFDNLCARS